MNAYAATMTLDQNRKVSEAFTREASRLGRFIRGRVADAGVAEDILQDVFSEFIEAERLMQPVGQVGAWLFRVARNRITDWFRLKKPESLQTVADEDSGESWEELLPSPDDGPEARYLRDAMLIELSDAIAELPEAQRAVFIAHAIDGTSFKQLAQQTGESQNTLLSRKHLAVRQLRKRLRALHPD